MTALAAVRAPLGLQSPGRRRPVSRLRAGAGSPRGSQVALVSVGSGPPALSPSQRMRGRFLRARPRGGKCRPGVWGESRAGRRGPSPAPQGGSRLLNSGRRAGSRGLDHHGFPLLGDGLWPRRRGSRGVRRTARPPPCPLRPSGSGGPRTAGRAAGTLSAGALASYRPASPPPGLGLLLRCRRGGRALRSCLAGGPPLLGCADVRARSRRGFGVSL